MSVKYLHKKMVKLYGKPSHCEHCDTRDESKRYDWANKDHKYINSDRSQWMRLCRKCHRAYDLKYNQPWFKIDRIKA